MNGRSTVMTGFSKFEDFYPFYVAQHSRAATRWLHFAGSHAGLALFATGLIRRRPALLALAPLAAYGTAWGSHFLVERNRPATFGHPLWSLRGDVLMLTAMWRGHDRHLAQLATAGARSA